MFQTHLKLPKAIVARPLVKRRTEGIPKALELEALGSVELRPGRAKRERASIRRTGIGIGIGKQIELARHGRHGTTPAPVLILGTNQSRYQESNQFPPRRSPGEGEERADGGRDNVPARD